jgi:hypothetical protein
MAVRLRIREHCDRCGAVQAREEGDCVVFDIHRCPKAPPPGPRNAPHLFPKSEVVFIRSER